MDHKTLAQLAALVFLATAAMAAAVHWASREERPDLPALRIEPPAPDPLRDGQRRCQQLGEPAARDAACLKIWSDTRDRFLGRAPAPGDAADDAMNGGR